ncbi:cupin domain-containing protein [Desulfotruncus alcoholivorax]|uniref:cupin domain-containing protein n=1 Tax=Desulfotruncus alcoholivorax TaxID=265477 RepID=UPI00040C22A1|nr:cupin domain-containing protein [Desulfotruncus alcoholivorax]
MYVDHVKNIKGTSLTAPGILNATKQTLLGPAQGWQGWVMRLFTLAANGHTPRHSHPWPHINYIVSGKGTLFLNGTEHAVEAGSVAYVPGDAEHQFKNAGSEDFSFICIVPEEGDV